MRPVPSTPTQPLDLAHPRSVSRVSLGMNWPDEHRVARTWPVTSSTPVSWSSLTTVGDGLFDDADGSGDELLAFRP